MSDNYTAALLKLGSPDFICSTCHRADSVMDLHATCPAFATRKVRYTSYRASD